MTKDRIWILTAVLMSFAALLACSNVASCHGVLLERGRSDPPRVYIWWYVSVPGSQQPPFWLSFIGNLPAFGLRMLVV